MHRVVSSLFFILAPLWVKAQNVVYVRLQTSENQIVVSSQTLKIQGQELPELKSQPVRILYSDHLWQIATRENKKWKTRLLVNQENLFIQGLRLTLNRQPIPGFLRLKPTKKEKFDVIAKVGLETYIAGVVGGEMPKAWPKEALKAQSVAARSYALSKLKRLNSKGFHLEADEKDQVFRFDRSNDPVIQDIVRATAGMVLRYKKKILKAFYHSDCGGSPASAKTVWGFGAKVGHARNCPSQKRKGWQVNLERQWLSQKMKKRGWTSGPLAGLKILGMQGKRVTNMLAWDEMGNRKSFSGHEFRQLVGYRKLRSTVFQIRDSKNAFELSGRGFGHGVGLCQWGAKMMAERGRDYTRILKAYYPKAELGPLASQIARAD